MKKEAVFLNNTYLCGHEIFFNLSEIKEEYPLHFHEFYELELLIERIKLLSPHDLELVKAVITQLINHLSPNEEK